MARLRGWTARTRRAIPGPQGRSPRPRCGLRCGPTRASPGLRAAAGAAAVTTRDQLQENYWTPGDDPTEQRLRDLGTASTTIAIRRMAGGQRDTSTLPRYHQPDEATLRKVAESSGRRRSLPPDQAVSNSHSYLHHTSTSHPHHDLPHAPPRLHESMRLPHVLEGEGRPTTGRIPCAATNAIRSSQTRASRGGSASR